MGTFRTFEDIEAWQESRKLVRMVRALCKRDRVRRDFSFIDQITRAARSVSANIAEGNDALSVPDFITFLGYAKRSSAEVRSHLYDGLDEEYISKTEWEEYIDQSKKISRMIANLIQYLSSIDQKRKRIITAKTASS